MDEMKSILTDDDVHPIRKQFDCFADSVIKMPADLQRSVRAKVMNVVLGYEEISANRLIEISFVDDKFNRLKK